MSLVALVVALMCIGIGLYCVNKFGGEFIDGKILRIINIVAVIAVIVWLLSVFGLLESCNTVRVPRINQFVGLIMGGA